MRHVTDPIPRIRKLNPRLPKQVEQLIRRTLAKSPHDRFQTAAELAAVLRQIVARIGPGGVKWTPAVQIDTLAGQGPSVDPSGASLGIDETGAQEVLRAPVDSAKTASRERPAAPLDGPPRRGILRRVPRWALVAGAVVGFLIAGAAFAAGVTGGVTRTPTPTIGSTEFSTPTQASLIVATLTRRPSSTPTAPASPTTSPTPIRTVPPIGTETEPPPPPPTPAPTLPPTVTPAPPPTNTEVPPPTPECTPPVIICEPE